MISDEPDEFGGVFAELGHEFDEVGDGFDEFGRAFGARAWR